MAQWDQALTPGQLCERTRRYWVCNPEARRLPPKIALCIARGIVREVYEIESWEVYSDMANETIDSTRVEGKAGKSTVRRGFIGHVTKDPALRASLVGTSVRHVPFGTASPIAYAGPTKQPRLHDRSDPG